MDQGRGVEKPSEIQYLKKSTNLWPAQLWHDGHHELLQDRIWMWHTLSLFLPFLALCFFTSKIQCSRLWTFFHHHRCRHVRHHHQKSLSVQGWNLQQRENATAQVTCASRAWQETHIEPIGPITPKLCSCSLQSSDCHCHCLSDSHCHSVFVIISSSPIGCHCLNISDIVWLSMSLFFSVYDVCLHLGLFIWEEVSLQLQWFREHTLF